MRSSPSETANFDGFLLDGGSSTDSEDDFDSLDFSPDCESASNSPETSTGIRRQVSFSTPNCFDAATLKSKDLRRILKVTVLICKVSTSFWQDHLMAAEAQRVESCARRPGLDLGIVLHCAVQRFVRAAAAFTRWHDSRLG